MLFFTNLQELKNNIDKNLPEAEKLEYTVKPIHIVTVKGTTVDGVDVKCSMIYDESDVSSVKIPLSLVCEFNVDESLMLSDIIKEITAILGDSEEVKKQISSTVV